jgi:hypothetical protein
MEDLSPGVPGHSVVEVERRPHVSTQFGIAGALVAKGQANAAVHLRHQPPGAQSALAVSCSWVKDAPGRRRRVPVGSAAMQTGAAGRLLRRSIVQPSATTSSQPYGRSCAMSSQLGLVGRS